MLETGIEHLKMEKEVEVFVLGDCLFIWSSTGTL